MDTTSIDAPSSRAIAKQLLTLSQDPDNQPFIVQEKGCLAGLTQYTQHDDVDVVLMATRALQFLSSNPQNKETMREFPDLISNVSSAMVRQDHPKIKEFAKGVLSNLSVCFETDDDVCDKENMNKSSNSSEPQFEKGKKSTSYHEKISEFRTVVFSVPDAHDADNREILEKVMIRCSGVISVTVNQGKQQVVIGTRESGDGFVKKIADHLENAGFSAKVVIAASKKDEYDNLHGESDYPDYIEEDDYEEEDMHAQGITRQGFGSLESRLEQQRKEEEERKQAKSSRLIGKMSNVLSNASSWLLGY